MHSPTQRASAPRPRLVLRAALLALLLALVALRAGHALADRSVAPQPADGPATIYLPLLARPGEPGQTPTPVTPTPVTPTPVTPTPEPGNRPVVRFTHDAGRAASAVIGPEGGSLSATAADGTRFELTIPAAALDFSETITMTPALSVEGLPFSGGLAGAVSIEPDGLELYAPATLRIVPPGALPPAPLTIGFSYRGEGERFHLYPLAPSSGGQELQQVSEPSITLELIEIRPVGAGRGSQADIDAIPLTEEDIPLPGDYLEEMMARTETRLDNYYNKVLQYELLEAELSLAELDEALRLFDSWLYFVESYGLTGTFAQEIVAAKELLAAALQKMSVVSAERCYAEKRPEEGFRLLRWARLASKHIGATEAAAIEAKLRKCLVFELHFRSTIKEDAPNWVRHYTVEAKLPLRVTDRSMRATGSGTISYTYVSWPTINPPCVQISSSSSTFDAASAGLGLTISPVSRKSPQVRVELAYNPGDPTYVYVSACPYSDPLYYSLSWTPFYSMFHQDELSGTTYRTTATITGAGSFEGWVYNQSEVFVQLPVQEDTFIDLKHTPERP